MQRDKSGRTSNPSIVPPYQDAHPGAPDERNEIWILEVNVELTQSSNFLLKLINFPLPATISWWILASNWQMMSKMPPSWRIWGEGGRQQWWQTGLFNTMIRWGEMLEIWTQISLGVDLNIYKTHSIMRLCHTQGSYTPIHNNNMYKLTYMYKRIHVHHYRDIT